jgi:DNA polymerase-3 subunit delta'
MQVAESSAISGEQPVSGWPVVGHDWAVQALRRAVQRDAVYHAYLVTGPQGVGKMSLALALAAALLCNGEDEVPCNSCRSCRLVANRAHPDLHIVQPEEEGGRIKIDQVRDLQRQLALTPLESSKRVAILRRFGQATTAAANALLKTLEEPPSYTVLVLLAEDADRLLPTVVSRCRHIALRPLPVGVIRQALIDRWQADPDQADLLARLSSGRIGWATSALDDESVLEGRSRQLDDLEKLIDSSLVNRFRYAEQLAGDRAAALAAIELWASAWRDIMLLAVDSEAHAANVDRQASFRSIAARVGVEKSSQVLQALRSASSRLKRNANARLTLEVLMLDLPRR